MFSTKQKESRAPLY